MQHSLNLFLVIEQFDNQDRHEFDDQMALEVHSMKEHLFTLLSKIQAIDGRLPGTSRPYGISRLDKTIYDFIIIIMVSGQNEYLLLSGSARDGTVDLEIQTPSPSPEPGKGTPDRPGCPLFGPKHLV